MYLFESGQTCLCGQVIDGDLLIAGGINAALTGNYPSSGIDGSASINRSESRHEIRQTVELWFSLGLVGCGSGFRLGFLDCLLDLFGLTSSLHFNNGSGI